MEHSVQYLETLFQEEGKRLCMHEGQWNEIALRRFRSVFGTSPLVCAKIWSQLMEFHDAYAVPKHLLFALVFLNVYKSEHVHRILCGGVDEKTFRKYSWKYIYLIAEHLTHLVRAF